MEHLYKTTKEAYIKLRGGGSCIKDLIDLEKSYNLRQFHDGNYGDTVYESIISDIKIYTGTSNDDEKTENIKTKTYQENLAKYLITQDSSDNPDSNLLKIKNFIRDGTKNKILLIDGMNLIRNYLFFISILSVRFKDKHILWSAYQNSKGDNDIFKTRITLLRIFVKILSTHCKDTQIILFYHGSNKNSVFKIDKENEIGFAEISCYEHICNKESGLECYKSESLKKHNEVDDYTLKYVEQLFKILKVSESDQYKSKMKDKELSILSGDRYAWMYKEDGANKQQNRNNKTTHDRFSSTPRVFIKFDLSTEKITLENKKKGDEPNKLSELYFGDGDKLLEEQNYKEYSNFLMEKYKITLPKFDDIVI
jgi:hypothetical protein